MIVRLKCICDLLDWHHHPQLQWHIMLNMCCNMTLLHAIMDSICPT